MYRRLRLLTFFAKFKPRNYTEISRWTPSIIAVFTDSRSEILEICQKGLHSCAADIWPPKYAWGDSETIYTSTGVLNNQSTAALVNN